MGASLGQGLLCPVLIWNPVYEAEEIRTPRLAHERDASQTESYKASKHMSAVTCATMHRLTS